MFESPRNLGLEDSHHYLLAVVVAKVGLLENLGISGHLSSYLEECLLLLISQDTNCSLVTGTKDELEGWLDERGMNLNINFLLHKSNNR